MTDAVAWLRAASARLAEAGIADAGREARLLLRWASGAAGAAPLDALTVDAATVSRAEDALARRAARVPLSHVTGRRAFWAHDFAVTPDVLDPRPDTETLVEAALALPPPARVLDAGVGSGCILLSLLAAWPSAWGIGVDISAAALAVARVNARRFGVADRVGWVRGAWLDAIAGPVDLLVSNPPYLTRAEMVGAPPELAYEPAIALDGGEDGLDAYRALLAQAVGVLAPGGVAMVEIGVAQGDAVSALFARNGFQNVRVHVDLDGRARVVAGNSPKSAD